MQKYELILSYANVDLEDFDQLEAMLEFSPELDIWSVDGQVRVRAVQEATSAIEAVEVLVESIHKGDPTAVPEAVEFSLVTVTEIADIVNLNREAVRLWTVGKRGPGNFPAPVDIIAERTKVWANADVWRWLSQHSISCPDARPLTRTEVVDATRAIDRLKRRWANRPLLSSSSHWQFARHDEATVSLNTHRGGPQVVGF